MDRAALLARLTKPDLRQTERSPVCHSCGGSDLQRDSDNLVSVCSQCGSVEYCATLNEEAIGRLTAQTPRIRIVGPGASELQACLNAANQGSAEEAQLRAAIRTFQDHNTGWTFHEGGKAAKGTARLIPEKTIIAAAEAYLEVQKKGVVFRDGNRRSVMAHFLHQQCLIDEIPVTPAGLAAMMELKNGGTSSGNKQVLHLIADGKLEASAAKTVKPFDVNLRAICGSAARHCAADPARLEDLARKIHERARKLHIGTNSTLPTQAAGCGYIALRRLAGPAALSLDQFCAKISQDVQVQYRQNTIKRYVADLDSCGSQFRDL